MYETAQEDAIPQAAHQIPDVALLLQYRVIRRQEVLTVKRCHFSCLVSFA